jgi:hypothetical protein
MVDKAEGCGMSEINSRAPLFAEGPATWTPTHICPRCEFEQPRGELHHCVATDAWKAKKALWWAQYNASKAAVDNSVHTPAEPENVHSDVHSQEPLHSEPVHSTVEEEHPKVDISEVDTVDKVDAEEAVVHSSKEDARREYEREYKRRKRAEAKAAEA